MGIAPKIVGEASLIQPQTLKIQHGNAIAYFVVGGFMSHLNLKTILPAAILLGGFLVCTTASYGTAEFAKTTKKTCVYCHEKNVPATRTQ